MITRFLSNLCHRFLHPRLQDFLWEAHRLSKRPYDAHENLTVFLFSDQIRPSTDILYRPPCFIYLLNDTEFYQFYLFYQFYTFCVFRRTSGGPVKVLAVGGCTGRRSFSRAGYAFIRPNCLIKIFVLLREREQKTDRVLEASLHDTLKFLHG